MCLQELEQAKQAREGERLREEDRLARKRNADMVAMQNQAAADREKMRRQTEMEIQEERRKTDERRAVLERENMKVRAMAEAEGRIREMRENEDVYARQIQLRGEQTRIQIKEAIETTFSSLGAYLGSFITDREKVASTILTVTAVAAGVYSVREGARVAGRVMEKHFLTPALVRETSKSAGAFSLKKRLYRRLGWLPAEETGLGGVVLRHEIDQRVQELVVATRNTKANGAPFRHMLFYGPPGTGKTMVAKRLARSSGLDYAIMSGGDVGPLGRDAVTELHKLFDWGERSSRGLLLFIDEADAFLSSRSRAAMSEDQRNALNALLFRTGEASRNLMIVMATNRPGDLDAAVGDRVDESLVFDIPDLAAREKLLTLYFDKFITRAGEDAPKTGLVFSRSAARIEIDDSFTPEYFKELARRTEGFSGRAISKLMISVQGSVYGKSVPKLTKELMEEVVQWKLREFDDKRSFGSHHLEAEWYASGAKTAMPRASSGAATGGGARKADTDAIIGK